MIEVKDLSVSMGQGETLHVPSLKLPGRGRGQGLFLIHGDNGTGKTTLVRCIAGIRMDWTGSIKLDGRDIRTLDRREIAGMLTYLPQASPPDVETTVEDYIRQGLYAARGDIFGDVVNALGLKKFLRRDFSKLSGGERQLARLARALSPLAGVSILDEPETHLSRANRFRFERLVRHLSRDRAVIMVSHSPFSGGPGSGRIGAPSAKILLSL